MSIEVEQEPIPPAPFVIRAHHISNLLMYDKVGPVAYTEGLRRGLALNDDDYDGRTYITDVIGTTGIQREQATSQIGAFADRFWRLDDEATVSIVTEQRDGICDACIFGKHCEPNPAKEQPDADDAFLDAFTGTASRMGLSEQVTSRTETTESASGATIHSRIIETNAATARKVISSKRFRITNNAATFELEKQAEKEWKKSQRHKTVQELLRPWRDSEYKRLYITSQVARVRPLVGGFAVCAAASMVFHFGQAYQAVEDSQLSTMRAETSTANTDIADNVADGLENGLEAVIAGAIYTIFPKRRRLLARLERIRSSQFDEQAP